ncbi:MAG: ExbD/TolR family protein [Bdellovibrionia bacterium]
MLKRPCSRRKSHQEPLELNLVPILDAMVTLIGFLLFTTSFLAIVSIESPLPVASLESPPLTEKPLQLTLAMQDSAVEISSAFGKVEPRTIPNTSENQLDLKKIHDALVEIKKRYPQEVNAVILPLAGTSYDDLIGLMDAIRMMEPSDASIYVKNEKTGMDEPIRELFPKVVFGDLGAT